MTIELKDDVGKVIEQPHGPKEIRVLDDKDCMEVLPGDERMVFLPSDLILKDIGDEPPEPVFTNKEGLFPLPERGFKIFFHHRSPVFWEKPLFLRQCIPESC